MNLTDNRPTRFKEQNKQTNKKQDTLEHLLLNPVHILLFYIGGSNWNYGLFFQKVDPFELEQIKVLETFIDGRRNELNNVYPVNIPGGTVIMYKDESERECTADGPVKSMKRKGGSPPMQQERETAKNKRQ